MLIQHRYKITAPFIIRDGVIIRRITWKRTSHEGMPYEMKAYKPSKKRWDFVDYSGKTYYGDMEICETTRELERRGKLIYIGVKKYE